MDLHQIVRSALLLGIFGVCGTAIVAFVHHNTKARITANERAALLHTLHDIMPDDLYDNDIVNDTVEATSEALGDYQPKTIYLAYKEGKPVGAILTVTASRGYNGPINLLVGINNDLALLGVRVTTHRETPGLGDKIELRQSPWIKEFDGRSIGDPPENRWAVKRDGGIFDQFTGATITPRAVVEAVRHALLYFAEHKEDFFTQSLDPASSAHE